MTDHQLSSTETPDDDPRRQRFLTSRELAARWSQSLRTIEGWRYRGVGPSYIRLGGQVRYRLAVILAYEAAREHGTSSRPEMRPRP